MKPAEMWDRPKIRRTESAVTAPASAESDGGVADPVAKRCRRRDAHAAEIVDPDALIPERRCIAEDRAGQGRGEQRPPEIPGSEQAERNGIAAAPRPLVFAMVVVGEGIARELLDPVGPKLTAEAIAQDLLFVRERPGVTVGVGAVECEVPAVPALVAVVN